ncbi:MAG: hypothetical protein ACYC0X_33020 [Pirellulaceae bacterium]
MSKLSETNDIHSPPPGAMAASSSSLIDRLAIREGEFAPPAPSEMAQTGVDVEVLLNLVMKWSHTVPNFTTEWATRQLHLPVQLVEELCWKLKQDRLLEILGQLGPFSYKYAATERGRELAHQLMQISGFLGPAPVSLEDYSGFLEWQVQRQPKVTVEQVTQAISGLVLSKEVVEVAALATASGRSLFMFGPPGNGKTSLGRTLHGAYRGEIWIPYCINLENNVIRIFDAQLHERVDAEQFAPHEIDRRWIRIRRPFVVAGGEMTMEELDLAWSPSLRFYEAPPHVKANGGTFLIDDFGRQRIEPHELLNRWIIPLEHRVDHLTLATGQKIQLPFRLMLIVATNLKVSDVADPAFLRRMGYRLHLDTPTPHDYAQIFQNYAAGKQVPLPSGLVERILQRYISEGRELRSSEPRDLIERALDICRLREHEPRLDQAILDTAWRGYFGNVTN